MLFCNYYRKLPTILIIEKAMMPTTIPAIPQIKADLAACNLLASPWAVKNIMPATTKQITATALKIRAVAFRILDINVSIETLLLP